MKGTIKELTAEVNAKGGVQVAEANMNGFVKVMQALGKATVVGKGEKPKRGRVADVFEVTL